MIRIIATISLLVIFSCAPENQGEAYDWHIHGGTVIDGTGEAARQADVLIREDTIAFVGEVDEDTLKAENKFDASGYYVTPGFIDAHAHGNPLETPEFENFLAMGVTSILLGQDGSSPETGEFDDHLKAAADSNPFVNLAWLAGHNTIRRESGVGHGAPDENQVNMMADMVNQAMHAGAFGLSHGLEYNYGRQARMPELVALAEPVADYDGIVMSHMRNEDHDKIEESVEELLTQGRRSGAHVHASHLKIVLGDDPALAEKILATMEDARNDGAEVSADVYPYHASYTGIGLLFPEWASPPNDYEQVITERRDELAGYLRERVHSRNGPEATLFGSGGLAGKTLAEVAEEERRSFEEVLIDLGPNGASAAYFVMDEDVMKTFIADGHTVISSDGSPTMHHPRGYGSFAKVLNDYTPEDGFLGIEEAIRKMSGLTAHLIGLDDPEKVDVPRGLLKTGFAADILVFDPDAVTDRADFEHPHRLAEGMRNIWVNGRVSWRNGESAGDEGAGRVLRNRAAGR